MIPSLISNIIQFHKTKSIDLKVETETETPKPNASTNELYTDFNL